MTIAEATTRSEPGCCSDARSPSTSLRIAYLTTKYPSVSHTFIRRELREIERRGHRVLRLAIRPSDATIVDPLDREEHEKTHHCLGQPKWRLLAATLTTLLCRPTRFAAALRTTLGMARNSDRGVFRHLAYLVEACYLLGVVRRAAVQHIHVHFGTNAAAVARLVRILGGPTYSFTVHGPDELDAPIGFDLRGKVHDAAFVVAITDYCRAQLCRWSDPDDWARIQVVRCTVGEDFFEAAEPIDPTSRTFVCIGRLAPQKGQLLLIDALAEVVRGGGDARLTLVGDGELRSTIEQRVAAFGLRDRVEITGYVSEAEVRRHLLAARALVLPSFAEGLPMVIMEAYAVGRPVISTYIAGIPELVRPGENGWLVPAGNVPELVAAMGEALRATKDQLEGMAAAGRARTRERHLTATEATRLEALFAEAGEH